VIARRVGGRRMLDGPAGLSPLGNGSAANRKGCRMTYEYDICTIGLGPAGMAVSIMGAQMGLKICGIEARKVGGECMNVGCIPSKSLLQMAKARHAFEKLERLGLAAMPKPAVVDPFPRIAHHLRYINDTKTMGLFDKVDLVLRQGTAGFLGPHTVEVGGRKITARRIFICAGTRPALPPVEGLAAAAPLTNETMFDLPAVPESLIVIGGGAIACEMAQAFSRLGCRVTMVMRGKGILWREDEEAARLLQRTLEKEGIAVRTQVKMQRAEKRNGRVVLHTEEGLIEAEHVLAALGRRMDFDALRLENAGVEHSDRGIKVDAYLRTTRRHILAPGDCNGYAQFSHAAMHQGMIALLNCMLPWPFKRDFRRFVVPWTVFTEPPLSFVGQRESELKARGIRYETVVVRYEDYGAAIAEELGPGFVKVFASPAGRILGVYIIGEGSGEMINEWGLAIQKRIRMHDVMFLQHSFPAMAFLSKRASEQWTMNRLKSARVQDLARRLFRLGL
jgi:pyruvate/2-oxoglutarate dehydrogenase complex dihydrolipoamide dehydrogenase (E3) component